ncbi:DUF1345 domain-containing protein [Phenylobacterium hankyongense]|uniref:DUF1345 domain-containing protein n=1 Tax=Phenylobacterium hankyongense TaxID=1813876 RepID=A0A328AWL7_9CAUL|nr:DUF1345 domain-containing protein [Phenylobacterium hankyongense]RAK58561.1 DUF1345 domain-containing protein [Phenylobacterium hankyongense]
MTQGNMEAAERQAAWMALLLARPRLWMAFAGGLAVGVGCHWLAGLHPSTSVILGWDATCLTYIGLMMHNIAARSPEEMRARAARDDQSRGTILVIVLVAAVASVVAVGLELSLAKKAADLERTVRVALAFVTVASSWFMIHLMFALHYAHGYYDCDAVGLGDVGGLKFPGDEPPDYWDFLHFSVIIGVASQTADVAITSKALRRLSTVHSLFAFAFNTVIVALTINLLAGLLS